MSINARHRKHFKSGAIFGLSPLDYWKPSRKRAAVLRPVAKVEPKESLFRRFVRGVGNLLMGRKYAAA